jgi:hypothetical protein
MMRKSYEIVGRDGRIVDDDHPVLRDGETLRVPLHMRDHETLSPQQREVMADKAASLDDAARRFGLDDALGLHKPGQRFSTDQAANDAREEARRQWIDEMCDAWRKPAADASSGEFRGAQEGDVCTVREGGVGEGSPGHLRMVNGKLTCVPDKRSQDSASVPRTMTADAAQAIKDAAWRESVEELESAWRKP